MKLIPLAAFADNYIWLLHNGQQAMVVDPGDAQPVRDALQRLGLQLQSILVTHHHADHTGGIAELRETTGARVFGPLHEPMPEPLTRLGNGDIVDVLGLPFTVMEVPGHTAGHIAYFCSGVSGSPLLFCGDTLFSGGCGRLFEGTPAQMLTSLTALCALPGHTRVCCTHEYTLSNLRFARHVEPDNTDLQHYQNWCMTQRSQNLPTLPSTVAQELLINPFLRVCNAQVVASAHAHDSTTRPDELGVFTTLRKWKNQFQ